MQGMRIDVREVEQADGMRIMVFSTGERTHICVKKRVLEQDPDVEGAIYELLSDTAIYNDDVFLVDASEANAEAA